jgi:hypothetical protein
MDVYLAEAPGPLGSVAFSLAFRGQPQGHVVAGLFSLKERRA